MHTAILVMLVTQSSYLPLNSDHTIDVVDVEAMIRLPVERGRSYSRELSLKGMESFFFPFS